MFKVAAGLTVIVKVTGLPMHPLADGVMVISAVIGAGVLLVVLNEGILPVPLATKPIAGLLLVQLKIVPGTGPETVIAGVDTLMQKEWSEIDVTVGIGKAEIVPDTEA